MLALTSGGLPPGDSATPLAGEFVRKAEIFSGGTRADGVSAWSLSLNRPPAEYYRDVTRYGHCLNYSVFLRFYLYTPSRLFVRTNGARINAPRHDIEGTSSPIRYLEAGGSRCRVTGFPRTSDGQCLLLGGTIGGKLGVTFSRHFPADAIFLEIICLCDSFPRGIKYAMYAEI